MEDNSEHIRQLLAAGNLPPDFHRIDRLAGDGSDRIFYRLTGDRPFPLIIVFPDANPRARQEAEAAFRLGSHFLDKGISVPGILGYDRESGALIFADLGDVHLQARALQEPEKLMACYERTIDALIDLQLKGRSGFPQSACWDTPRYDRQLMLERESAYFYREFCREFCGIGDIRGLDEEFHHLADQAAAQPADFVLHRDFQSRNIMLHEDQPVIIDFQGARLGPLAYDLASLLLDPYVGLDSGQQQELRKYYLSKISKLIKIDPADFLNGYYFLALQRNLQILGAFAFLSEKKGKTFFKQYINPALASLDRLLQEPAGRDFPRLREVVALIRTRLTW